MEGDGPSGSMVLYEYSRLINTLDHLKVASQGGLLEAMFEPMRTKAIKYRDLALKCEPILMATMLHPAWRLLLFANKFQSHHTVAQALLLKKFNKRQAILGPPTAPTAKEAPSPIDPEDEGYNFYPSNPGTDDGEDELNRYHEVKYSLGIKGNILAWWKSQAPSFPVLASLARNYLSCAASSASVKQTFSAAADICTTSRGALAPQTIERCISSHLWIRKGVRASPPRSLNRVPISHLGTAAQKTPPTAVLIGVRILRISSSVPLQTLDPGIGSGPRIVHLNVNVTRHHTST
ncbi:hypothetical protein PGTUg99_034679 [Puccinia graminis f. sp. tritici]|uniref:HAT C-terminal dimerisation domain-containing protein n=2 Tax=Puccinia graminis f. sp. tritici TaxID=56615 RepID=A0A5B0S1F8_PUCGR|nr:hypothetical protein PGTUg99_034679 [Puccinia graminis f. sp. tritici]